MWICLGLFYSSLVSGEVRFAKRYLLTFISRDHVFSRLAMGGNQYKWGSPSVIRLFVGTTITFALFLCWEYRSGENALLPFSLLRARVVYSASATMFSFMGVMLTTYYYLPIYFQVVKNDSSLMGGIHILPSVISQVLMTMSTETLSKFRITLICFYQ